MSITPSHKAAWLGSLKYYLGRSRTAQFDTASSDAFYIALGMIAAATSLRAISDEEADRLSELNLNASSYRSRELPDKQAPYTYRPTPTIAQEQSA